MNHKTTRITALVIVVIAILVFGILPSSVDKLMNDVEKHDPYQISTDAMTLHQSLVIADMHADTTLWNRDMLKRHKFGHIDLPRMREGNQAIQVFTTVTKSPFGLNYHQNDADQLDQVTLLAMSQLWPIKTYDNLTERAIYQANKLHELAQAAPNQFMVIRTKEDMNYILARRSAGERIIGGLIGTEGSHALEGKIENIDRLYKFGFRMMSLQHFFDNYIGGSLHGAQKGGLTEFGREVVRKIDAMPIVLDVSHSSEKVVEEVLAIVDNPVVISHTGTHGHCPSPRNISDQLMLKIAQQGGVIGIGFWNAICDITPAGIAKAIQAAVKLVGANHVALGSDFDGAVKTSIDVSELAAITQALLDEGMSENVIRKVMGENMIRLFYSRLPSLQEK